MEHHGGVDPVQELGAEEALHFVHHLVLHPGVGAVPGLGRIGLDAESQGSFPFDQVGSEIAGHYQDGIPEVHLPATGVGQSTGVKYLQQDVEDLGVGLLDLIQQDRAVVLPADPLGQLPALVIADVPRRCANEAGHGMTLLKLGHVEANHRIVVAEHELGQGAHQLGLADAGGSKEQEHTDGAAWVLQTGPGAAHGLGDADYGLVLADDALVKVLLHAQQAFGLLGSEARDRDTGPHADHFGNVVLGDDRAFLAFLPVLLQIVQVLGLAEFAVAELSRRFILLGGDGLVLFPAHLLQHLHGVLDRCGGDAAAQAHPGPGLVDQVNGLVRQEAVGDEPGGQGGCAVESFIGNVYVVVVFVAAPDALENIYSLVVGRFLDAHRLQPTFQGGVPLHVLAVVVQGGCADALEFSPREGGLQDVGGVHRALCGACADDGMYLVDEEHAVARALHLFNDFLQSFLELAPVLGACDQCAHVQGDEPLALECLRDFSACDALGQTLNDCGLADARLTGEHRVVLGAAAEYLDHPLDFLLAPDHRVQLVGPCEVCQIRAELVQGRCPGGAAGALAAAARVAQDAVGLGANLIQCHAQTLEDASGDPFTLAQQAD